MQTDGSARRHAVLGRLVVHAALPGARPGHRGRCRGDRRRDYRPDGGVPAEARGPFGRRHRSRALRRRGLGPHDRARHLRDRCRPHGPRQELRARSRAGAVGRGSGRHGRDRHHRDRRRHRLRVDVGAGLQVRRARRRSREGASASAGRSRAGGRIGIRSGISRRGAFRRAAGGRVRGSGQVSSAQVPGGALEMHRRRRIAHLRAYRIRGSRRHAAVGQGRRPHDLVQPHRHRDAHAADGQDEHRERDASSDQALSLYLVRARRPGDEGRDSRRRSSGTRRRRITTSASIRIATTTTRSSAARITRPARRPTPRRAIARSNARCGRSFRRSKSPTAGPARSSRRTTACRSSARPRHASSPRPATPATA